MAKHEMVLRERVQRVPAFGERGRPFVQIVAVARPVGLAVQIEDDIRTPGISQGPQKIAVADVASGEIFSAAELEQALATAGGPATGYRSYGRASPFRGLTRFENRRPVA